MPIPSREMHILVRLHIFVICYKILVIWGACMVCSCAYMLTPRLPKLLPSSLKAYLPPYCCIEEWAVVHINQLILRDVICSHKYLGYVNTYLHVAWVLNMAKHIGPAPQRTALSLQGRSIDSMLLHINSPLLTQTSYSLQGGGGVYGALSSDVLQV